MKNALKKLTAFLLASAFATFTTASALAVDKQTVAEEEHAVSASVNAQEDATYAALRNAGFSHEGACGIMGNIAVESGFGQTSRGYFGLMDDRWEVYLDYCEQQRYVQTAIGSEIIFMIYRLGETNAEAMKMEYPALLQLLLTTDDPSLAAAAFCVGYERSIELEGNVRNVYPEEYKNLYWPYDYYKDISYQQLLVRERSAEVYADEYDAYRTDWTELGNPYIDVSNGHWFNNAVSWAYIQKIVDQSNQMGVTSTRFRPESACTRAQFTQMLWNAAGQPEPYIENIPFRDVSTSSYFYKAISWAYQEGVVSGTSSTTFEPNSTCTRAQIVQMLWNAAGQPIMSARSPFTDVKSNGWYYNAVLWAVQSNVTYGTSTTTFEPNSQCTKAQTITFLYRYDCLWSEDERTYVYPA